MSRPENTKHILPLLFFIFLNVSFERKIWVTVTDSCWSDDFLTMSSSAIGVDVAGENDHVGSPVGFVTTSEEEGAEEASYAQRGPLFPIFRRVLAEDRAEYP